MILFYSVPFDRKEGEKQESVGYTWVLCKFMHIIVIIIDDLRLYANSVDGYK